MKDHIAILPSPPREEPSDMRGRTRYTVRLSDAPTDTWERHFQDAHKENLHSMWFPFEVRGDEISFQCPASELQDQLKRLGARIADANARLIEGGPR